MIAKNRCAFVFGRGSKRGEICSKNCLGTFCGTHKKAADPTTYSCCKFCDIWTRSKYGVCIQCYLSRNVRYHLMRGKTIEDMINTPLYGRAPVICDVQK